MNDSITRVANSGSSQPHASAVEVRSAWGRLQRYGRALPQLPLLIRCALDRPGEQSDDQHIRAGLEWLLRAQSMGGGGGYAHSFSFVDGWIAPYPETTGYLIPTLHQAYVRYQVPALLASAVSATQWLYAMQRTDGAFADLHGYPQVFDTGQILIGFNYVAEHLRNERNDRAIRSAAEWLVRVQEPNGSFVRHAYHERCHSYYSRVGAALIRSGRILGVTGFEEAGCRNLEWTLSQQSPAGYFSHMSFDEGSPFLHTMVYVMEGLLDGYELTRDRRYLDAVLRFAEALLRSSSQRDHVLRSRYHSDFSVADSGRCLVGLAQWAGVCFRLLVITGNERYRDEGYKSTRYVKSKQLFVQHEDVYGGLPGSAPVNGRYMGYSLPNWGLKFFIDALLLKTAMPV
ncbi:MAG: hypothetical protein IT389_00480 [Nitrospira sp.]|nr:hypothetical protein [Nitrospira sp.]